MKLRQIFEPLEGSPVAFIIRGSPDPDSIASSLALLSFYQEMGGDGKLFYDSYISHSSNKAMINILGIQMERVKFSDLDSLYKHYTVVDYNNPVIDGIDCSKCILHIDHHKESSKEETKTNKLHHAQLIDLEAGACSSIITRLLDQEEFFQKAPSSSRVATALAYGIRSDTDNLDSASPKDWDAMRTLAQFYSKDEMKQLTRARITPQTAEVLKKALLAEKEIQNWLFASVGFLQESYRDSIAVVADELMKRASISSVLVYGIIEKGDGTFMVDASVRSVDSGVDLDAFTRSFSPSAGGRKYKGGFQIPLEFWSNCPISEMLEAFVSATIESKFQSIIGTTRKIRKESKEVE